MARRPIGNEAGTIHAKLPAVRSECFLTQSGLRKGDSTGERQLKRSLRQVQGRSRAPNAALTKPGASRRCTCGDHSAWPARRSVHRRAVAPGFPNSRRGKRAAFRTCVAHRERQNSGSDSRQRCKIGQAIGQMIGQAVRESYQKSFWLGILALVAWP